MADQTASELLDDVPAALGDLIGAIGRGVADAQLALDTAAIEQLKAIAEATADDDVAETLRAIGYQPTWYRIPELNAEINLSLTLAAQGEQVARGPLRLYATPIDASFSNKYVVNAQVASRISFKVVAVPPAPQATELRVVPNLIGRAWDQASETLQGLGIAFERREAARELITSSDMPREVIRPADSDPVVATLPEPGTILLPGVTLVVTTDKPQDSMA